MGEMFGWTAFGIVLASLSFGIAGESLFQMLPSVRRFTALRALLADVVIDGGKAGHEVTIKKICRIRLEELLKSGVNCRDFEHRTMANVIEIVHLRRARQARLVRELKTYCLFLSFLFGVALFKAASSHSFALSFPEAVREVGSNPLEFLGFLELVMIGIFALRLLFELPELGELVREE